ncbi:zinc finger SWIM domain-containing protein 7 isoform X2 [Cygnus atratus]|uniref:zinc finger SWIM domain-containing protein 7 isoform X2 n=1 Tax=Cygnus atratus TaxID=8868 RepID=UPI0015D5F50A|nr:zinc finger SWIM domain-containing protein 7 isoform X2 [Cygnus atratus]
MALRLKLPNATLVKGMLADSSFWTTMAFEGLKFVFGPSAVPALDLVDHRSVTRVVSPSGRTAYQVLGTSGKLYTCYSSCHFCTCPAFGFTVLQKSESLLCKHILAVYLSQAMGACQELTVSEEQLTNILLAEEEDEG